ncbi:CheR family methyltransferase [Motilibacter deserti]|uniref:protein-glutamate O-methyltransferase n=1 Tax=Motilibacter deserti TaxID=2714956 RepID=A0ABX0H0D0_9ACTN|nr:protein-glutamate O-methyltransferase CheR [Motilibacter deserti]NHC15284.1 protein-glutamate O-methyltransferase CheR [Motilibacter deserti]
MSTAARTDDTALSEAQFARVREWVYRRTGIQFAESKRYFVDKRVQSCVRKHGGSFDAWFAGLRLGADPALAQQLINELTVNETYFLREDHQFEGLVHSVLPAIAAERRATGSSQPIRILSLPCSTGEEAYSIGLRLLEDWEDIDDFDVEIVAGDIDTRVLSFAQRGEYGPRSMQRVPLAVRTRWFDRVDAETYRVKQDLRDAMDFRVVNVCDSESMRAYRDFDVIFCRNLLIYFDEVSSRRAAENLFGALRPGGHLFLGHSESMSRISPIFTPVRLPEGIVYRRPPIGAAR